VQAPRGRNPRAVDHIVGVRELLSQCRNQRLRRIVRRKQVFRGPLPGAGITAEPTCKTFTHSVEVYLKKSGESEFNKVPISQFLYKGFVDANGCRVAAKNQGQIYDTAEAWPNVIPPASGMDVYRVLSLPTYKGALVPTVIFVEFEKR